MNKKQKDIEMFGSNNELRYVLGSIVILLFYFVVGYFAGLEILKFIKWLI